MSGNYSALMTMAFIVAIAMAANRAEDNSPQSPSARTPASLKKEMILGSTEAPLHRHTEKIQGPVEATVELLGERPEEAGDVFVLKGTITSSLELTDVDFKWALPQGVVLINGDLHGQIAHLGAGKPAEITLTLKSLTGENHQVHLIASARREGTRFAQSIQYNTLMEPVLEAARKDVQKSAKESEGSSDTGKLRIFH